MTVPRSYDPTTLYHWLWYKYLCHECTATEFQRLFENIIKRVDPDFMDIRAYGKIGDRKCDGLFFAKGTVFQVYSPDELSQEKLIKKINEDLDGAVAHWRGILKRWVFVYNVRRGLPPDVPKILLKKREVYPDLEVDHINSDRLWEMARKLSVQERAEVLGPPPEHEYFFGLPTRQQIEKEKRKNRLWGIVVQDVLSPINLESVKEALEPDIAFGPPFFIRPKVEQLPWEEQAEYQRRLVAQAIVRAQDVIPRFAVFSFAPIPLAIHLGFLLSDRLEVQCFQFDRDRRTWRWPESDSGPSSALLVKGLPQQIIQNETDAVIRISLSAKISTADIKIVVPDAEVEVEISCQEPNVSWLHRPVQLVELGSVFRATLSKIRDATPNCRCIHLFFAGPTGAAVVVGQQINPRMNPPLVLYEYSRNTNPRYRTALTLTESKAHGAH